MLLSKFLKCESPSTFLGTCLSHHSFIIFLVTNTNTLLSGLYLISALHYAFGLEQCHHYWCQCPLGLIPHFYENTQSSRLVFRFWVSMPSRAYISFLRECVDPAPFAYMEFQCPLGLISHFYLNIELVVNSWQEISMPSRAYISFLRYPFKNLGFMRFPEPVLQVFIRIFWQQPFFVHVNILDIFNEVYLPLTLD